VTKLSRSRVTSRPLDDTRLTVSVTGVAGTAASAPARTVSMTAVHRLSGASGRAASWTATTSTSRGIASRPARTDSDRVDPPATTASAFQRAESDKWSGWSTKTRPEQAFRAISSDQSRTGLPASSANCFSPPNRDPLPAATTRAQALMSAERTSGEERQPCRAGYGNASSSFFSASASSTPIAKVSSETKIWRARLSIRFSPADRPLSLSLLDRLRTTSAT
jgi:hypothetical protein